jgi:hypothetical protein
LISSIALAQQLTPPSRRLALEITIAGGLGFAATMRITGSAAAPSITDLRLQLILLISVFFSRRLPGRTAAARLAFEKDFHYVTA